MNNEAVPAVNHLDAGDLSWFSGVAHTFLVACRAETGDPAGFLIGLEGPGLAYRSDNYRWFSERYERFIYVDRVVVAPEAWGLGLGRSLYTGFISAAEGHPVLCAEVNLLPRNDRSLAFHEAFGFVPVGEQDTEGGSKRVQMLALEL
ncbi:MAG: GNAT family N-acetyltransferase [Actinobacteria bacterium]|nr:GNAT family N-acetyltransferase [Actinomycetota bacterium]MBT6064213.1 GNAT family N-acetyltransferase [Actinomycetota bacterium]